MSDAPETFPGMSYYAPEIGATGTATTLPVPDDLRELRAIREAEKARRKRGIGFTAAMHDD